MLAKLLKSKIGLLVREMAKLVAAYVSVSGKAIGKAPKKSYPLPPELLGLKNLTQVAVTTYEVPIDRSAQYLSIVSIIGFEKEFHLVGGLNLPKKTSCLGSDGINYTQLIKGKDDLRQDAVMEQVFQMVNTLLQQNPNTRKRRLAIKTYKVVPLSPNAGLLEWVDHTLPIGQYLTGAHG
jgi:serine-protein kinase ATM